MPQVEFCPPKTRMKVPVKVTLFENRLFAANKQVKMKWYLTKLNRTLAQYDWCLMWKGKETQTNILGECCVMKPWRELHVKVEAESGIVSVQSKIHQRLPATIRSWERNRTESFSEFPEGTNLLTPWFHTHGLYNCERIPFCSFKPLSLGQFAMAALWN